MIPFSSSCLLNCINLKLAPLNLKAPVFCWFSILQYTCLLTILFVVSDVTSGVRCTMEVNRSIACCTFSPVNKSPIDPHSSVIPNIPIILILRKQQSHLQVVTLMQFHPNH